MKLITKNKEEEKDETTFSNGGGGSKYDSIFTKKTYYLITHPALPGYTIKNYGDRDFIISSGRWSSIRGVSVNGDDMWDITDDAIHRGANFLLLKEIEELKKEKEPKKEKPRNWFSKLFGIK